jgi:hypothetical protein
LFNNKNRFVPIFNDYEINNLSYDEALKYDKRSYCKYYLSLLRTKHLFIDTFYLSNDYNSRIIKIILFLFIFDLNYTINALFFTSSVLHEIFVNTGIFNLMYHLPQICYSTVISAIIKTIIKNLSLSQKNILEIKQAKNIKKNRFVIKDVIKCLKIKFTLFFLLCFLFLIFFWYYLACFCAVYKNTQIHLIKDTVISFSLSLLYPFGLNLIPGLFRIPSIKGRNKKRICLYKTSRIIELIM